MPDIAFQDPQYLWLLLPLTALALWLSWRSRAVASGRTRLVLGFVRGLIFAAAVVALARPFTERIERQTPKAATVILRDASDSVRPDQERLDGSVAGLVPLLPQDQRVLMYQFAASAAPGDALPADTLATDLETALDTVYRDTMDLPASQVVVLTDGRETRGNAQNAARRIALRGGAVHFMPMGKPIASPPRLLRVDGGIQNHVGLPVTFTATLESVQRKEVQLRLIDPAGRVVDQREASVQGKRSVLLQATPQEAGLANYQVELRTASNGAAGLSRFAVVSDSERAAVDVEGPPRILLMDPFPDEVAMLREALKPLKVEIEVGTPEDCPLNLSGYAAVILSDFSGNELTATQRTMLKGFVEGGGGLVMVGGANVVPERWKDNPLSELLPVALEPKRKKDPKPKPQVAVCYVLDRSGSMGQPLGAGASKLDMVKASVQASLRDLPEEATVSIIVFDDKPDLVLPPTSVKQKDQIFARIDQIALGGGTSMAPAIGEAIDSLRAFQGERHLVVLTDGQSQPPPRGSWDGFSREARLNDIHWTSIAVGADADQPLLRGLADHAGGTYFFCENTDRIPKVFIAQARDVRRKNDDQRQPFTPRPGPAAAQLRGIAPDTLPELADAVETSPRPGTDVLLLGREKAPLLASWRYGLGLVVAFSSDAKPQWARRWSDWEQAPAFWSQLVQRCLRPPSKIKAKVATYEDRDTLRLVFTATDDHGMPLDSLTAEAQLFPAGAATTRSQPTTRPAGQDAAAPSSAPIPVRFSSPEPGIYEARIALEEGAPARLLVAHLRDRQGGGIPYAAVIKGRRPQEMTFTGPDLPALQTLAQAGNGIVASDPAVLAAALPPPTERETRTPHPLWPHAIALAAALWVLDLGIRKLASQEE